MTIFEFKDLELVHYTTGAAAAVEFHTDQPGGQLVNRLGPVALPVTTDRAAAVIPLDGIEGTQFFPKVVPPQNSICRLFSGSVRVRKIGVYLTPGEIWEPAPISLGV